MTIFSDIFHDIQNLPYSHNKNGAHELQIMGVFLRHGLDDLSRRYDQLILNGATTIRDKLTVSWDIPTELAEFRGRNGFVYQPCGSQASPDFYLVLNDLAIPIECKSGVRIPQFNSGLPKPNYIYIWSCQRTQRTTVFLIDSTILGTGLRSTISNARRDLAALFDEMAQEWLRNEFNVLGITPYLRWMFVQDKTGVRTLNSDEFRDDNFQRLMTIAGERGL